MIDKHAAHERILFEKFKSQQTSFQQMLLVPVTVTLSPDEYNAVLENKELLYKAGYDMEDFGDRCVKVNACPTELVDEDIASITMELASYLSMNGKTVMPEKLDWIYHSMACRAAIKAGNTTTDYELRKFVEELLSREDIRYCPHGRPVMVEVSKRDLEKQFKRIV
jgi:DNA mismatch repair protein MutL